MKELKARRNRWDPVFPSTATTGSNFPLGYTLWKWKGAGQVSHRSGRGGGGLWIKELGIAVDGPCNVRQSWELCHPSLLEQLAQVKQTVLIIIWRYACDWPRWSNDSKTGLRGTCGFLQLGHSVIEGFHPHSPRNSTYWRNLQWAQQPAWNRDTEHM